MKTIFLSFIILAAQISNADVFKKYESLANDIIGQLEAGSVSKDQLLVKSGRLIEMGEKIMNLYAKKEKGCNAQFDQFLQEHELMLASGFDFLHSRYHDAEGLPEETNDAECYTARSMVAHPYMALALDRQKSPRDVEAMVEEFSEVAERAEILKEMINE